METGALSLNVMILSKIFSPLIGGAKNEIKPNLTFTITDEEAGRIYQDVKCLDMAAPLGHYADSPNRTGDLLNFFAPEVISMLNYKLVHQQIYN
ncbi:MAG: hypothetical protein V4496_07595 [Pseudomonadota bacterium]